MDELSVYLNQDPVGTYRRTPEGGQVFQYDPGWLEDGHPISLTLPLQEETYRGDVVNFVFSNLLPDRSDDRSRLAEQTDARSDETFDLLAEVGRDCVGSFQFLPDDSQPYDPDNLTINPFSEDGLANHLESVRSRNNVSGTTHDANVHKSLAGGNPKTSLIKTPDGWAEPTGTTPSTYIVKTQNYKGARFFRLNETEYFTMTLADRMGLDVPSAELVSFGPTNWDTAIAVQRFDRRINGENQFAGVVESDDRIERRHQEDFCQALGRDRSDKRPNTDEIDTILPGLFNLAGEMDNTKKAQKQLVHHLLFEVTFGCEDGHLKNYSLYLNRSDGYRLTPFYDLSSADPYDQDNPKAKSSNPNNTTPGLVRESSTSSSVNITPSLCLPFPGADPQRLGSDNQQPIATIDAEDFLTISSYSQLTESTIRNMIDAYIQTAPDRLDETIDRTEQTVPDYIHQPIQAAADHRLNRFKQDLAGPVPGSSSPSDPTETPAESPSPN